MIPEGRTPEETLLFIKALAVDNASEGICIVDATKSDNPLLYVNKGFIDMTGYSEEELLGRNCRFLQGSADQPEKILRIRKAVEEQKYIQEEIINFRKNGQPFWNKLSITPIFRGPTLLFFVGIQEDITAKKEREELSLEIANRNLILKTTLIAEQRQRTDTGAELHDNVNQLLAAARMYLITAIKQESQRLPMLEEGRDILDKAISEIRMLSKRLVSPDKLKPLEKSIRDLIESVMVAAAFNIEFTFEHPLEEELSPGRKIAMFRILQEQINNIYKYAECSLVNVDVFKDEKYICLSIKDNGKGFDPAKHSEGIGIKNMTTRAESESGTFHIKSIKNKGTEVIIKFPCDV